MWQLVTSLGCPVLCLHHRLALACLFTHTREHYNCLPLLTYCIGSLRFNPDAIRQLGVCWNDAFRKIFNFSRMESVKLLQYFFSCLDAKRYYDLCRWKFLSSCVVTCTYLRVLFSVQNSKYKYFVNLQNCYDYNSLATSCSFASAVYSDFASAVLWWFNFVLVFPMGYIFFLSLSLHVSLSLSCVFFFVCTCCE